MNIKEFYQHRENWNAWRNIGSINLNHRLFSSVFNSTGYPSNSFICFVNNRKISYQSLFKSFLTIPYYFIVRFIQLLIGKVYSNNLANLSNENGKLFQVQHEISNSPRKNLNEIEGVNAINDFNLSFLSFRNILKLKAKPNYICSFYLVDILNFLKVFNRSCKYFFADLLRAPRALSVENNAFGRVFDDLLKVEAFQALYNVNPAIIYVVFWENRGWQNYLAINYPENLIFVQLGYEGIAGPTFMNHDDLKGVLKSKFYFSNNFHMESCGFKNSKLATLPSSLLVGKRMALQNNLKYARALIISSIDNDLNPFIELCNNNDNFFLRPHPENKIFGMSEQKIDKRSIDLILSCYDVFLFFGTSTMILNLLVRGALCVRVLVKNKSNLDGYTGIIDTEVRYEDLSDYFLHDFIYKHKSQNCKFDGILGDVSVLTKFDFLSA